MLECRTVSCATADGAEPGLSLCHNLWRLVELGSRQTLQDSASLIGTLENWQKLYTDKN